MHAVAPRRHSLALLVTLTLGLAEYAPAQTQTPQQLYAAATYDLRDGHWYESAVARLTGAARQAPDDPNIHLALGCAEADRAASLSYAALFTKMLTDAQGQYSDDVKDWETAQRIPKDKRYEDDNGQYSQYYDAPRPAPPPQIRFQTKDDLTYLRLTPAQTVARIAELGTAALTEWKRARALAKTPDDQAEIACVQGWGRELLHTAWFSVEGGKAAAKTPDTRLQTFDAAMRKARANAVLSLQDAVKLAPDNADYWQALGDVLLRARGDADDSSDTAADPQVIAAYTKSLSLRPRNTPLWYHLYDLQAKTSIRSSFTSADGDKAIATLQKAAEGDPGNAYPQYLMAGLLFHRTKFSDPIDKPEQAEKAAALTATYDAASYKNAQDALAAVERGNAAFTYQKPVYVPPVPKLMARAWQYALNLDTAFTNLAQVRELARACSGYAQIAAHRNNLPDAERASRACIGLGAKMAGDWPTRDSSPAGGEVINTLVGIAVMAIGYSGLQKAYEQAGQTAQAQQVAAEIEALKQRKTAYSQAVSANLNNAIYENY